MSVSITVIIPVHNGAHFLGACLSALMRSSQIPAEIIVVDDGSHDNSADIARHHGASVVHFESRRGAAAARNEGVRAANGDVLMFVDSDVAVKPDTLARAAAHFDDRDAAAVFGSYDDDPAEHNTVSQYKNLLHHFVHQRSPTDAGTFWTGCGAIRRGAFAAVGGFDEGCRAVEDIDLGYRLRRHNFQIRLDKQMQVKHLKRWTLLSLLKSDIFDRAIPWSRLITRGSTMSAELNLHSSDRFSAALAMLAVVSAPSALSRPRLRWLPLTALSLVLVLNSPLYGFFLRRKSLGFTLCAVPLHLLYYLYSGPIFGLCFLEARARVLYGDLRG